MGGPGSSRWGWYRKKTAVEACRILDVGPLVRDGVIGPDRQRSGSLRWMRASDGQEVASIGYDVATGDDGGELRLRYASYALSDPQDRQFIDYRIDLETTRLNFGVHRWWWRCPGPRCGYRRAAKLYMPPRSQDRRFLCRVCHDLAYRSGQTHDKTMDRYRRMLWGELMARVQLGEPGAIRAALSSRW